MCVCPRYNLSLHVNDLLSLRADINFANLTISLELVSYQVQSALY